MSDPILDEDLIQHLLSLPVTHDTSDAVQGGSVQALIDLYDRKVTRDVFLTEAAPCVALYGQCAKYWMLGSIKSAFEQGILTAEHFAEAEKGLGELIEAQAKKVYAIVGRLKECPTSKDTVN